MNHNTSVIFIDISRIYLFEVQCIYLYLEHKTNLYSCFSQNKFHKNFYNSKFIANFAKKNNMHVISHRKLKEFFEKEGREDSKIALERWFYTAINADWRNLSEIKKDFPTTDYVGNQHYVFDIRGNKYRLVVVIKFTIGRIYIRFVGTHAEYDKINCATI